MYKLDITNDALNFTKSLPPKQFKQIFTAIMDLLKNPKPHDSSKLKGYPDLYRKDVGEYRIIPLVPKRQIVLQPNSQRNWDWLQVPGLVLELVRAVIKD